ncbi:SGNH/GDSL hydrolase family protein [Mycolicibacterium phocaicum]|uniref:Uncharacterized protein n=1 Tax=Mycolicibacterium phocaicum TaxID=319706 RepID=A0A7I7ZRD4_9MYCO|nr:SGNH/GDSL hydrolase family protein [Mycolicibacterium phocaicum]TLH81068.1 hypothetical protein C1S79_01310 [Mycolicibacterium phocaicum]BBZ56382.1 hypothetical protein MPHO_33740 [Mycolicibacterium phocaicum]
MSKAFGNAAVIFLVITVVILAVAVDRWAKETKAPQRFPGIAVGTSTAPSLPAGLATVVFIGDFTAGSDQGGEGEKNWTAQVAALLAADHPIRVVTENSGGSGYVIRGGLATFPDQVRTMVTPEAKVVVIAGSRNDMTATPHDILTAAADTYVTVHQKAPGAALLVVGPSWLNDQPPLQLLQARDAVKAAAEAGGATFVDPISDHWFDKPGLVGSDGSRPTDEGHQTIAAALAPLVSSVLDRPVSGTAQADAITPSPNEGVIPGAPPAG